MGEIPDNLQNDGDYHLHLQKFPMGILIGIALNLQC